MNIGLIAFKYILIAVSVTSAVVFDTQRQSEANVPKTPLHGIYNTELFVRNGDTLPPLLTDNIRWRRLVVEKHGNAFIYTMTDSFSKYMFKTDTLKKQFEVVSVGDSAEKYTFHYALPEKDRLLAWGKWQGDSIRIQFNKYNTEQFNLVNRGFHWVNEYPFNR